jgi:hypothetical protein
MKLLSEPLHGSFIALPTIKEHAWQTGARRFNGEGANWRLPNSVEATVH